LQRAAKRNEALSETCLSSVWKWRYEEVAAKIKAEKKLLFRVDDGVP
jgi:hypothetical protein